MLGIYLRSLLTVILMSHKALASYLLQMCERAAEAHKSKAVGHSSRRSRMSSDSGQLSKSSVDAILSNSSSASSALVRSCTFLFPFLNFIFRSVLDFTDIS